MAFNASPDQPPDAGLASSTIVFRDGLGVRRHVVDSSRGGTVEMLCLRSELNTVSSFEFALRERVNRLATFRHAYYAPVRGVERVNDPQDTLAVVSDVTQGIRLSDLLASLEERHATLDITAILCLIRQIVPAVAMLHESARDVAHGAIAPERLIVTPNARLVLVDYVLGAALEQLRYPHERYWAELRVALPKTAGAPRFDHRADVLQIGLVALSLILGRPIRREEFPTRVRELVAQAWSASSTGDGFEPLPPGLNVWLGRMLQLEALTAFSSAIEARAELEKIVGDTSHGASPAGLQTVISRHQGGGEQPRAPMPQAPSGAADATLSMDALDAALAQHPIAPARATAPGRPPISVRETTATVTAGPRVDGRKSSALAALDFEPLAAPLGAEANVSLPDMPPLQSPRTQLSVPELPPLPLTKGHPSPALPVLAPEEPVKAPRLTVLDLRPLPEPLQASRTAEIPDVPSLPLASQSARESARLTRLDRQLFGQPQRAEATSLPESRDSAGRAREGAAAARSGLDVNQQEPAPTKKGSRLWKWLGGAAILPGLVVGGAITAKRVGPTAPLSQTGTLVLTTNPDGARALVDGELRGVTPLTVELSTGMHEVELQGAGAPRTIPVTIGAGVKVSQFVELTTDPSTGSPPGHPDAALARGEPASTHPPAASTHPPAASTQPPAAPSQSPAASPASQQPSGWISVSSPFPVRILERGRPLAYAQGASVTLSAGRHEIELVNDELGFRGYRTVDVKSGQGVTVQLEAPKTTVSLNALPWAEVLIDGESVGETPIGNLSLTVGPHNVLFRHPDLGERRQAIVVTLKSPLRISVDLRKK